MVTEEIVTGLYFGDTPDFETSWVKTWLNEDFLDTLYNYQNIIVTDNKWDLTADYGNGTYPTPYKTVTAEVGLLNPYEFHRSIEGINTDNKVEKYQKSYLNNQYDYWLSSACINNLDDTTCIRGVDANGNGGDLYGGSTNIVVNGVRPAVVLKANVSFSKGSGTKENPYILLNDKKPVRANDKLNERLSGEYVKVDNKNYRIVGIEENGTTKLTSIDYVRDGEGNVVLKKQGENGNHTYEAAVNSKNEDLWGAYLNNTWLTENLKKYLVNGTYYLGNPATLTDHGTIGINYKATVCKDPNTTDQIKNCEKTDKVWTGLVGLSRVGEMFNYPSDEDSKDSYDMLLITPFDEGEYYPAAYRKYARRIDSIFYNELLTAKPSITLNSDVRIVSGAGTKEKPYEIKCDTCG